MKQDPRMEPDSVGDTVSKDKEPARESGNSTPEPRDSLPFGAGILPESDSASESQPEAATPASEVESPTRPEPPPEASSQPDEKPGPVPMEEAVQDEDDEEFGYQVVDPTDEDDEESDDFVKIPPGPTEEVWFEDAMPRRRGRRRRAAIRRPRAPVRKRTHWLVWAALVAGVVILIVLLAMLS